MTATYTTLLTSKYFSFSEKYISIKIEANDLDTFVKIVEHCRALEELQE